MGASNRQQETPILQVQVLGLLAVLALPDAELPPEVAAGSHDILAAIVKLLSAYREQQVHTALLLGTMVQLRCSRRAADGLALTELQHTASCLHSSASVC